MNHDSLFKLCSRLTAEKFQTLYLSSEQTKYNIQVMISHHDDFAVKCNSNTSDEILDWLSSEGISICSAETHVRECYSEDEYEEITESMNLPDVPPIPRFSFIPLEDLWNNGGSGVDDFEEKEEDDEAYWPKWCEYKPPLETDEYDFDLL